MPTTTRTAVLWAASLLALTTGCSDPDGGAAGDPPRPSGSTSGPPSPSPSPPESATAAPTGPGTRALFFGSSYFVGGGYTGPDDSMAAVAADRLGWDRQIAGGGGTGFVAANPEYGLEDYLGQIRGGALDVGPVDWLVVEGGTNDRLEDPAVIERNAVAVLTEAAQRHPEARLVLVGALDPTLDDFSDTDPVTAALRAAAEQVGVPFIDCQRWLEGQPDLIGPDYLHPLPEGHQMLGNQLADALLAAA